MVVLVTGGSGFIGSHLVDELLASGYDVRVFDKAETPNGKAEWFKGDLLSKEDVFGALQDIDTVYHLGAVADVNVAATDPQLCLLVNELGTLNLLSGCTGHEVERLILASSVWVYGRATETVTEETSIPPPNDLYTKTKIGQEHLLHSWSKIHGLPYTILRYDIPYGPRMRTNMAIAAFLRRAQRKEPIAIYGDGSQGRCWIFVADLAKANCLAMKQEAVNQTINLAGEQFVTIAEIVNILKETLGEFPVRHEPARPGDFSGVRTSIEKARRLLGWSPTVPFREGIAKYIASMQS
jgi:UDP-glucose 4-epimerase